MLNFSLLGYVEVGFLKRYPYPCPQTDTLQTDTLQKSKCSSSLGPSWESNQARFGWQVGAKARLTDFSNGTGLSPPRSSGLCPPCLGQIRIPDGTQASAL